MKKMSNAMWMVAGIGVGMLAQKYGKDIKRTVMNTMDSALSCAEDVMDEMENN